MSSATDQIGPMLGRIGPTHPLPQVVPCDPTGPEYREARELSQVVPWEASAWICKYHEMGIKDSSFRVIKKLLHGVMQPTLASAHNC